MNNQPECHHICFSIEKAGSAATRRLEEAGYKAMAPNFLSTVNRLYETGTTKDQNQAGPEITLIPLFNPSKGMSEREFLENVTQDIKESLLKHTKSRKIAVTYSRDGFPDETSFKIAINSLIINLHQKDVDFELVSYCEE